MWRREFTVGGEEDMAEEDMGRNQLRLDVALPGWEWLRYCDGLAVLHGAGLLLDIGPEAKGFSG